VKNRSILKPLVRLLVLIAGGTASALTPPLQPQCYMFESAPTSGWTRDPLFEPFVRVDIVTMSGTAAGTAVAAQITSRLAASTLASNHINILLQGFGHEYYDSTTSTLYDGVGLLHNSDAVTAGSWPSTHMPSREPRLQPWMTNGISRVGDWMDDFITQFETVYPATGSIKPARFDFDTELYLWNLGNKNFTHILKQVAQDSTSSGRFTGTVIPGIGDTLKDLWDDRTPTTGIGYGWGSSTLELKDVLDTTNDSGNPRNQMFYRWYSNICDRAVDGAMKASAYDKIWAK